MLERVKSFVFHLNEPMKLDDYQMAQNNLQQQWNTARGGKIIHKWSQLFTFIFICKIFSECSKQMIKFIIKFISSSVLETADIVIASQEEMIHLRSTYVLFDFNSLAISNLTKHTVKW